MNSVMSDGGGPLGNRQMFTDVGVYKGNMVAILPVDKPRVTLGKTDLKELTVVCITKLINFDGSCDNKWVDRLEVVMCSYSLYNVQAVFHL